MANTVIQTGDSTVVIGQAPGSAQIISATTQGPPGPPGPSASLQLPAGATVSADTAVAVVNGQVYPASSGDLAQFGNVVGIASNGGAAGTLITILQAGEISLSSWNFTLGQAVFVGTTGPVTQTPPTSGFVQQVGIPTSSTSMAISIEQPIQLV